ncbi:nephrin-like isoform X2 [Octopus sinensis]|uniref:Nephrin-like isoform X2 n=1 Tax=Octopus sinensis TaxID=2607531 RepID=A0A7E6ETQ7_9MOLL|nr:nephrin-like isoform X2 [Octopus sinensis]
MLPKMDAKTGSVADDAQGRQMFRTKPQNVSAIKDQTVILKCEVMNQSGRMQWSKNGFALGYDKSIPGFSRYEVVGNLNLGEYNLMITNVELRDDTEYQCQVLPTPGNPPLMASAYLTVHIPPDVPKIVGHKNASTIDIPYTQDEIKLECVAHNGRPAARLEWFKDGEKITTGISYRTETKPGEKLSTAISVLTYRPKFNYNDALLSCQASNDAVQGPPLETFVQLSISFPPGEPHISGYHEGQVVRINDTLHLKCVSEGGNPPALVIWYKNNKEIDRSYFTEQNKAENDLTLTVESSDNDAIFKCEASNTATVKPLVASFKLTVHFPPKKVKISGHRLAKAGQTVTLKCVSTNSNPAATITWFARGRQLPDENTQVKSSPKGGFISTSITKVNLTGNDNNVMYTCVAKNEYVVGGTSDSVTLSVLYPPASPTISGYNPGSAVHSGESAKLTCTAIGGNPLASLKWYTRGRRLDSDYKIIGNIASADLNVIIKPEDNGAIYVCKATNNATVRPLQTQIRLKVFFPPVSVNITTKPDQARAGQKYTLTCECSSSNPEAEIIWLHNSQRLQGNNLALMNGSNGGKITINILEIIPTPDDHMAVYGCRAINHAVDKSVNDGITLDILFKPVFNTLIPHKISILEDEWKSVNFSVRANPEKVRFSLWRDGRVLKLPRNFLLDDDGLLNLTKVKQKDSGDYQIKAVNKEGATFLNFTVDILYAANITHISTPVIEDEGGIAYLECIAEANPMSDNMVGWTRDSYDMSRTRQTYDKGSSSLTVYELSRTDAGTFTCSAYNGYGKVVTRVAQLIVKYPPQIDQSRQYAKAASDKGGTATLICKADGAPLITFSWSKGSAELKNSDKYNIKGTKDGDVYYTSLLEISNVTKEDYGKYLCKAKNVEGSAESEILLDGTSKPDPPYNIKFVNATHNSLTLTWQPGFNGGMTQSFRVRYRPKGTTNYKYVDVGPGSNVYLLTGLERGQEYEITMLAFNKLGESQYQRKEFIAKTSHLNPPEEHDAAPPQDSDDMPLIIILVVCIVGIFLLALNIGLIMFFIRRKRKRLERHLEWYALHSSNHSGTNETIPRQRDGSDTTSHTNTFELFGSTKESHLYPMSPSEDARSYDTYDKSLDEFSDECSKNYEDEDMKRVFLPPHDYSDRPYTPCKQDSPHVEPKRIYMDSPNRQIAYLDDSDTRLPNEDLYMTPKKKTETFEPNHYGVIRGKTPPGNIYEDTNWSRQEQNSRMRNGMVGDYLERAPSRPCSRAGPSVPLSPSIVPNPCYESPSQYRSTNARGSLQSPIQPSLEMKGHLV